MDLPKISIIIPCRNEKNYIEACLDSVIRNNYPQHLIEVFVVDGQSTDGTIEKIKAYQKNHSSLYYVSNPNKTVPFALNIGIKKASGDFIIILGAHSKYPNDYFKKLIYWQNKTDADNIGGLWKTQAGSDTQVAKAIAIASSSIFGVGNALYRINHKNVVETDTVPFGCYKKEVFKKIGYFDEELTRNQDDEFNGRLKKNGGKIILVPEIHIDYFARKDIKKMSKMFYQYGLYKPLVNKKLGKPATSRQLAPPIFAFGLLLFPLFLLLSFNTAMLALSLMLIYLISNIIFSLFLAVKNKNIALFAYLPFIFFSIHSSYGFGYLKGLIRFVVLNQKGNQIKPDISR